MYEGADHSDLKSHFQAVLKLILRSDNPGLLKWISKFTTKRPSVFKIEKDQLSSFKQIISHFTKSDTELKKVMLAWLDDNKKTLIEKAAIEPAKDYKPRIPDIPHDAAEATLELLRFMRDQTQETKDFRIVKNCASSSKRTFFSMVST